jgi:hypothetical protein
MPPRNFQLVDRNFILPSGNVEKDLHNGNEAVGNGEKPVGNETIREEEVKKQRCPEARGNNAMTR